MINFKALRTHRIFPWIVWGSACSFYFYVYILQVLPNVIADSLEHVFKIDAVALGKLGSYYFLPYIVLQLFSGALFDRFGMKRLLILAICLNILGCFLFAFSYSYFSIEMSRVLMGVGGGFAMTAALSISATWFAPERFSFLVGLVMSLGMLGAVLGSGLLSVIISVINWRGTMIFLGVIGFVIIYFVWRVVEDQSAESEDGMHALILQRVSLMNGLHRALSNKQVWLCGAAAGLIYFPTIIIGMLWGVPFLVLAYQTTQHVAAALISVIFLGWIVGAPFFGWFFERIGRRRYVITIGAVGLLISSILIIYLPIWPRAILVFLLFMFGFFSAAEVVPFVYIRTNNAVRYMSALLGFSNLIGTIGGVLVPPIVGFLLTASWGGTLEHGVPIYSVRNYQFAFIIIPVLIACALFFIPRIQSISAKAISPSG